MAFSFKRMRRRTSHNHGPRRISPPVIVAICLAAAVLITVIVGNILKMTLDEELYRKLTEGDSTTGETQAPSPDGYGVSVQAPVYAFGDDIADLAGYTAISVPLNRADGSLNYTSPVALWQGRICASEITLSQGLDATYGFVRHISGVYRVQAFAQAQGEGSLWRACAMEEGALLDEFFRAGGTEVVLTDLPFATRSESELVDYVKAIRGAVGEDAPIGVALPMEAVSGKNGGALLEKLLTVCDFYVVDLRGFEMTDPAVDDLGLSVQAMELLQQTAYYRSQYHARLLISQSQEALRYAIEYRMISDYQITAEES
ncbi:MAG: hypothetical protein IJX62_08380 [Clostridia bacterium]|nr:hypothetical protein [Clostridia bacterium]